MQAAIGHHKAGRVQEAERLYERVLARQPDNALALRLLSVLKHRAGDGENAEALARRAADADPTSVEALHNLGRVLLGRGKIEEAIASFRRALSLDPGNAGIHGALGGALAHQGKLDEAAGCYRRAVDAYMRAMPNDERHPFTSSRPDRVRLTAWTVIMEAGGHQIPHIHPRAWLSGVYYVQLPSEISADAPHRAGWIELGCGPDEMYHRSRQSTRLIQPAEGLLVLFPAFYWHRTIPITSDERRISVALDVVPTS